MKLTLTDTEREQIAANLGVNPTDAELIPAIVRRLGPNKVNGRSRSRSIADAERAQSTPQPVPVAGKSAGKDSGAYPSEWLPELHASAEPPEAKPTGDDAYPVEWLKPSAMAPWPRPGVRGRHRTHSEAPAFAGSRIHTED